MTHENKVCTQICGQLVRYLLSFSLFAQYSLVKGDFISHIVLHKNDVVASLFWSLDCFDLKCNRQLGDVVSSKSLWIILFKYYGKLELDSYHLKNYFLKE